MNRQPEIAPNTRFKRTMLGAAVVILGIATCIKTRVEEKTNNLPKAAPTQSFAVAPDAKVMEVVPPPLPSAVASPAVIITAPVVVKKEKSPLVQACDDLVNPESTVSPYDAFYSVAFLTHTKSDEDDGEIYPDVGGAQDSCNLKLGETMATLKRGLNNGDTRLAGMASDFFEEQCAKEFGEAEEKRAGLYSMGQCSEVKVASPYSECEMKILDETIAHCAEIPDADESKQTCGAGFRERIAQECRELSHKSPRGECQTGALKAIEDAKRSNKEIQANCPAIKAGEFDMDIAQIRQLDSQRNASILATQKLAMKNLQLPFSDEDALEYMMAMRRLIISQTSDTSFYKNIGVINEADFKAKYIDEVVLLLKGRGEEGKRHAASIEAMWLMRGILKD